MSLNPEDTVDKRDWMAESTEVKLYQFKPSTLASSSNEESDLGESDTDVWEQASFMERLGKMDWCICSKCIPMPCGIECQCYREMDSVQEWLMEWEEIGCVTSHDHFAIVCLNWKTFYIQH